MPQLANRAVVVWAKTGRGSPELPASAFHPLICHSLDVAAVAESLLRDARPTWRALLSSEFALEGANATTVWCSFLAGLHDLGKATPVFQSKSIEGRERDLAAGLGFAPVLDHLAPVAHGLLTAAVLPVFLHEEHQIDSKIAAQLAATVGGHHGRFPRAGEVHEVGTLPLGGTEWGATRKAFFGRFSEALEIRTYSQPRSLSPSALSLLAGITSVADWIASAVQYFPLACPDGNVPATFDAREYLEHARARARDVLGRLGWTGWQPPTTALTFRTLFPGIETERPVQREVRSLVDGLRGPALLIVEAETGSGKTEAALSAAESLFARSGHEGLYLALPTRATSDQMFVRVRDFLARRYPDERVNLHLLHGSAAMSVDYEALRAEDPGYLPIAEVFDHDEDGAQGGVTASTWFAQRKRGLLSPFAVGTIDQALLAVLQTRHQFVRLAGLAGKVVVIDEVHAYDAYMSVLLERLLEWLGAFGSSVLLLSATLPQEKRRALERAYARGLAEEAAEEPDGEPCPYPRVSWRTADDGGSRGIPISRPHRSLHLDRRPTREKAVEALLAGVQHGGNAAFICNTVRAAQETFVLLEAARKEGQVDEVLLLHSQFRLRERSAREAAMSRLYGPAGDVRPRRSAVVATQVIEQSLDVDFDLLASELAPVDLLLQRAGRLHRHSRMRPTALEEPTLVLVSPSASESPIFERGSAWVYSEHLLLRTWAALRGRSAIQEPEDLDELIEFVYGEAPCPPELLFASELWEESRATLLAQLERDRYQAKSVRILPPDDDVIESQSDELAEDAPDLHPDLQAWTRLAEPSIPVVLLHPEETLEFVSLPPASNRSTARWLLERSVSVSSRRAYRTLAGGPAHWPSVPLLRGHRFLHLDEQGAVTVADSRLRLDDALGLIVDRQKVAAR